MRSSFIGWLFGVALLCAQPGTDSGGGIHEIRGRVLDADTGAAVPRARVYLTLVRVGAQPGQWIEPLVTLTDPAGSFHITNIPAGSATLSCDRAGYIAPESPKLATASVTLNRKDTAVPVTLFLRRHAVIRGTAMGEGGFGLGGIVQAYRLALVDGRQTPQAAGASNVDLEGAFRISGLRPGRYYVAYSPNSHRAWSLNRVYRPVIYPGSPDLAGARIIALASGDEQVMDFRPASEPACEIIVKPPATADNVSISIEPVQATGLFNSLQLGFVWSKGQDRIFRSTGLPYGEYVITGQWMEAGARMRVSKKIAISGSNVAQVIMESGAPAVLSLAVSYDPPTDSRQRTFIQLWSGSGMFTEMEDSSGSESFNQLSPGIYAVVATGNGYVKSARQGGRNALREGVVVPEEGSPEPLEVTIGKHSARLETKLELGDIKNGEVVNVAFLRQTPAGLRVERQTSIHELKNTAGLNQFSRLEPILSPQTPGEYVVIAWAGAGDVNQLPYNEPAFVDRYASLFEHATVSETGRQTVIIHHLLPAGAFEER